MADDIPKRGDGGVTRLDDGASAAKPADPQSLSEMLRRKQDHIDLVLAQRQQAPGHTAFDAIALPHEALPDVNLADIDLSTHFLGHSLRHPFLISSMTGGPERAEKINTHLAEAARELGLAMGVGSQRVALTGQGDGSAGLEGRIRELIGSQPLFANLGAVQLIEPKGEAMAQRAIDSLEADALILHLNPMQEVMQDGGDTGWKGVAKAMEALVAKSPVPIIVKEVGYGLSVATGLKLLAMGVAALDVAGKGGTNFGLVEGARSKQGNAVEKADLFRDWGYTTPQSLALLRAEKAFTLPLIASGGIRHGLDAARAIYLGADLVGQAGPVLSAALHSTRAVVAHYKQMAETLRVALFGTGSGALTDLQNLGHRD